MQIYDPAGTKDLLDKAVNDQDPEGDVMEGLLKPKLINPRVAREILERDRKRENRRARGTKDK
jgi:hypothetical protein